MYLFREKTPARRGNRAECEHYYSYHESLCEDFNKRCGYCDDSDRFRIRSFTIDHFVPQNPKGFLHDIKPNYYYNLVYSCRYCNTSKSNKWPSGDPKVFNDGKAGFVDPTTEEYTNLFKRTITGRIIPSDPSNNVSRYIIEELKLWLPIHERMWKLERLKLLSINIKRRIEKMPNSDLKINIQKLHYTILLAIEEVQDNIFVENN